MQEKDAIISFANAFHNLKAICVEQELKDNSIFKYKPVASDSKPAMNVS